jgi:hypothetical protein
MWPSAVEKRDEPKIQWLSKTQDEKERAIERELENDDDYESDFLPPV